MSAPQDPQSSPQLAAEQVFVLACERAPHLPLWGIVFENLTQPFVSKIPNHIPTPASTVKYYFTYVKYHFTLVFVKNSNWNILVI
jgi:hypothetical protein